MTKEKTSLWKKCMLIFLCVLALLMTLAHIRDASASSVLYTTTSELKFVFDKGAKQEKIIGLTALADNTKITITSSDLLDKESGSILSGNKMNFNNESSLSLILNKYEQRKLLVSITSDISGTFSGNIFLLDTTNNNMSKLPVVASVNDDQSSISHLAIILFIGGFFTSLGFYAWRSSRLIAENFNSLRDDATTIYVEKEIYGVYIQNFEGYLPLIDLWLYEAVKNMESSNVDETEVKINQLKELHKAMMDKQNFDVLRLGNSSKIAGYYDVKEFIRILTSASIDLKHVKRDSPENFSDIDPSFDKINFSYWKYLNIPGRFKRIILINSTSIILGLVIALGSMMQQDYFKDLNSFDMISAIIFFGLGAATDSLKQIAEKVINRDTKE